MADLVKLMRSSDGPAYWINPDHVVSLVTAVYPSSNGDTSTFTKVQTIKDDFIVLGSTEEVAYELMSGGPFDMGEFEELDMDLLQSLAENMGFNMEELSENDVVELLEEDVLDDSEVTDEETPSV